MLLELPHSKPARFTIGPGSWRRGVVRVYFTNNRGERCCIDSRVMQRVTALKLATKLARNGVEVEVHWFQYNMVKPPPHTVHRCRRLDEAPAQIVAVMP